MKIFLACFVCAIIGAIGCTTASQPTVQTAGQSEQTRSCSAQDALFDPGNETDVGYLQLYAWRLEAAVEDAAKAPDVETARAILSEGESDVTRLRHEYAAYWDMSDHTCYYCGPVCRELNQKLLGERALENEDNACHIHCCWTPPS
jgi:hypothetical protein